MSFPSITTEGPFGTVRVWATSATHIGADHVDGTTPIHGIRYKARLDLHHRDGAWQRGYLQAGERGEVNWSSVHNALWMSRVDDWDAARQTFRPEPSPAARAKVLEAFEPWLVAFAESEAGRQLVRDGAAADVAQKRERIAAKRAELESELAEVARQAVEAGLEAAPAGSVRTFIDAAGTLGVMIDSTGVVVVTRATPADMWSAPTDLTEVVTP